MAFGLVIPTTAFASHDLGIYKVEKHVDLDSDETPIDLSCNGSDYALDGMWRIDHADQDDDDLYKTSIGRAVDVLQAYPSSQSKYHFLFEKNAIGRAQVKVWVTCIKEKTEQSNGHSHALTVTPYSETAQPGTFTTPSTGSKSCPAKTFISTTGFKLNVPSADPNPYLGHVSTSWMSADVRTWSWVIDVSQHAGTTVDYFWSCVNRKVVANAGPGVENHKMIYRYDGPITQPLVANKVSTVRHSCQSHYKAVVAGFKSTFSTAALRDPNADYSSLVEPFVWFLGMDPQPKSRDFKFLNSGAATTVQTAAICLNYRTT